MDLNKYLAKNNKTIAQHNQDLKNCLEVLVNFGYVSSERLRNLIYMACEYHDYGKVNIEFQKRVNSLKRIYFDPNKEVSHNVLSMYFINADAFENIDDYIKVLFAVAYHHNYCDVKKVIYDKKDLINNLLNDFETYTVKRSTLKKMSDLIMSNDIESILIKGFLHKCDYCASAECPVEIKNDFLDKSLEDLKNTWRISNPNADWKEMQNYCYENSNENIIVVAQTGMGKTEGGLRWIGNKKGFFVLPLKTAINAMYDRIKKEILKDDVEEKLSILHSESLNYIIEKNYDIDNPKEYNEKGKKLSMPLTISTMDQLFDFVFQYNGYEMKLATFSYSKIVIDEIQMYSPELLAYLIYGINRIIEIGGKVAIITATLSPFIRDLLGDKFKYKEFVNDDIVRHNVKVIDNKINADDLTAKYFKNIENHKSNKILVICNTIKKAQALYDEIKKEVDENNVNVFHTRFTKSDRSEKEEKIIRTGKEDDILNEIWITTSVVEASLDIDFDYLFTELQDLNSLFQRMGRCNRKGRKPINEANCFIYTNIDSNLISTSKYKGFIDGTLFDLSKDAISNINGVITESEKLNLINTYFTTERIRDSKFYDEYMKTYKLIRDCVPYTLDKINIRHINSVDIIPNSLYDENKQRYDKLVKQIKNSDNSVERIKLLDVLGKDVVSIPYYECSKPICTLEVSGRRYYVVDCDYDSKIGFRAIKGNYEYATFW